MRRKKKLRDDDRKKGKNTAKILKKKKKKWYSSNEDDDSSEGVSDVEIKTRRGRKSSSTMEDENTAGSRRIGEDVRKPDEGTFGSYCRLSSYVICFGKLFLIL